MGIFQISLVVADYDEAIDYFTGVLDFELLEDTRLRNQTGGRVFMFLHTDDFYRDYNLWRSRGVKFIREPSREEYGIVSVFEDIYGNLWDLIQPV